MTEILENLQDKDDKKAYLLAQKICAESAESDRYYGCFDGFLSLIYHKSSFVRTRGFALCCAQAKWDKDGKLAAAMPEMLTLLHDERSTVVRQCISALHEVVLYKEELCDIIRAELLRIDLSNYKDSMAPLIRKDIDKLLETTD